MNQDPKTYDGSDNPESRPSPRDEVTPTLAGHETTAAQLVAILDQYLADLKAGTAPSREAMLQQHPELASQLEACLAGIDFIKSTSGSGAPRELADFRILREVGRGGMGAVYEAEQISLGRRVALKILRFGAVSDPAALERFRREAETVANLHHTNIVPIFSFGCEKGINYYAMQFIDGPSLDVVLRKAESPLDIPTVIAWGLQAAEALDHAHQRHVVHRDVKPSNLILDDQNRVWLTDFGLAKRLDDVTLSTTGALLGTPRYMSPEQAAASKQKIDHRSDLYSLGATLYELLTGKPVFEGETHHAVIGKILDEEPLAPRLHRPEIPRDLETVLLKCLSKNPARRYDNATDLAEDLRACVQNRPIQARRVGLTERAVRWLQRNQQTAVRTATTVGLTACVLLCCVIAFQSYFQSRVAHVSLNSDTAVVADWEDSNGNQRTVALPTREPVEMASGSVDVRLAGEHQWSQTYRVEVPPGQDLKFEIPTESPPESGKIQVASHHKLLAMDDGVDVILLDQQGVQRYDAVASKRLWATNLATPPTEILDEHPSFRWEWKSQPPHVLGELPGTHATVSSDPRVVKRSLDVDADGTPDIVLASRSSDWLVALSGENGKLIWVSKAADAAGEAVAVSQASSSQPLLRPGKQYTAILSPPERLADINGDGTEDLLVTKGTVNISAETWALQGTSQLVPDASRWLEVVSGADGRTLWKCVLDASWFQVPKKETVPLDFCWFPTEIVNKTSGGSSGSHRHAGILIRSLTRDYGIHGLHVHVPGRPQILTPGLPSDARGVPTRTLPAETTHERIGILAGSHLVVMDATTGEILSADDTKTKSVQPVVWEDVDGDNVADAVLLEQRGATSLRCSVWSVAQRAMLWHRDFEARLKTFRDQPHLSATWPLVTDLDGDARADVILPTNTTFRVNGRSPRVPWGQIEVLDGTTGAPKWNRRILTLDQQIDHFAVGPDLDGDQVREIYTAVLWGERYDLYVDVLSGADGHSLWWQRYPLPESTSAASPDYILGKLSWWQADADGCPQLLAQAHDDNSNGLSQFCVISAGNGRLTHSILDVDGIVPADTNADGIDDLISYRKRSPGNANEPVGELQVFPGAAERWRRLSGLRWSVTPDLDGDGVEDLISKSQSNQGESHVAISSRSGEILWQASGNGAYSRHFADRRNESTGYDAVQRALQAPEPHRIGDLDGDGTPDLLAWLRTGASRRKVRPIQAVSGRTGKRLWSAGISVTHMAAAPLLDIRDLNHDGRPEAIVVAAMDWGYGMRRSYGTGDQQLWLAVLDGRTGSVLWKQPLSDAYAHTSNTPNIPFQFDELALSCAFLDLNDDGVLDLVVPAATTQEEAPLELRAFLGSSGQQYWKHALPAMSTNSHTFSHVSQPSLADLDSDGKPELLFMAVDESSSVRQHQLLALNRDGRLRWRWQGETPMLFDRYRNEAIDRRGPVVLRTASGAPRICLPFTSGKKLIVLDSDGHTVVDEEIDRWTEYRIWAADQDGDGVDEVVLAGHQDLRIVSLENPQHPLWQIPFEVASDPRNGPTVLGLRRDSAAERPVILLRDGPMNNSVSAIDVQTGNARWRCPGPRPRNRFGSLRLETLEVLRAPSTQPALVFCRTGHVAQCRQAIALTEPDQRTSNQATVSWLEPLQLKPRSADPRLLRQLPWNPFLSELVGAAAAYWWWGMIFSTTMIVLPGGFLWSTMRQRRWGLRRLALLPVATAVFLIGALVDGPAPTMFSTTSKLLLGLGFLPILGFVTAMTYWLARRQFARIRFWLAMAAAAAAVMAGVFFWTHAGGDRWLPGERYSLHGWYWICFAGAYASGCMMLAKTPSMLRACEDLTARSSHPTSRLVS